MERQKTTFEIAVEAFERLLNEQRRREHMKKQLIKLTKKIESIIREWKHARKEQIMLGWHKPLPNKPIARQKASPNWYRIRSFCQRRRPPNAKC